MEDMRLPTCSAVPKIRSSGARVSTKLLFLQPIRPMISCWISGVGEHTQEEEESTKARLPCTSR